MQKKLTILICVVSLVCIGVSAYSKDTTITKNSLLYVQDPAGDNFLVLKIEACTLGASGEVHCAMKPQQKAKAIKAGPARSFFNRLAYPG